MPDWSTIAGVLIGTVVIVAILSAIFLWLWNTTMPEVFGLKAISFWQALKLLLIAGILFGSPAAINYGSDGQATTVGQSGE